MARRSLSRDGFVARLTREVQPVADLLEPAEPQTTRALSEHLHRGGSPGCRTWLITAPSGSPAGAVVLSRLYFDQWVGWVYLRDPAAAAVAGEVVQRSPAWAVAGVEADTARLVPHVPRARTVFAQRWGYVDHPVNVLGPPDDHTRLATRADLDILVELYAGYELGGPATRWQLRGYLRQLVQRQFVIVYEDGGAVIGAMAVDGRTRRFITCNDLTVLPDHRRGGVAWSILARAQAIANAMGVGVTWAMAESNPIDHQALRWGEEKVGRLWLGPPHRFRGEGRLRRLYQGAHPIRFPIGTVHRRRPMSRG